MYELNEWQKLIAPEPNARQWEYLQKCRQPRSEVMFGYGSGGGGTTALLLASLDGCMTDGHVGLLMNRSRMGLYQPGGMVNRLSASLAGKHGVSYQCSNRSWTFSGTFGTSHLYLGHVQEPNDIYNYFAMELSFLGFDHLEQFTESDYRILRSRIRGEGTGATACNAVVSRDENAAWIPKHFAGQVPATMEDNPHLDSDDYKRNLLNLDPADYHVLVHGEWQNG